MTEHEKELLRLGTMHAANEMALIASLKRLAIEAGSQSKRAIDDIESACVLGIKNMTPTPNVSDNFMQMIIEDTLNTVQGAFVDARRNLDRQ